MTDELCGKGDRELRPLLGSDLRVGECRHAEYETLDGLRKSEPLLMKENVAILHVIISGQATTSPTGVSRDIRTS